MSISVVRLENQPVILVHVTGKLDARSHFKVVQKVADLFENIQGKVYLVIDLTNARLNLLDMVDVLTQMTEGWPGTASDPRVISMMVLNGGNSSLAAAHLMRGWEGWRRVFVFPNLAQALACARGPFIVETEEAMTLAS